MAEAFRYYRDELKLHVYPVDGPWSKKADPGKKPALASWWNYDPAECDVAEFFKPRRCHNIGVCPTGKLYIVDLDSKTDQGESVYEFIASKPSLAKIPRHRTRGGCHLVFFCEDVPPIRRPRSNKPYDKALFSPVSDKVGAELYHNDHQNVVFPPSIHPTGFKYVWDVTGEIPTVPWGWVVELFGFKLPGEREEKKGPEIPFHQHFKGDFKFLDLVKLFETLELAPELLNADDGKYAVTCPWSHEHTETAQVDTTSTVIYQKELGESWPGFKCLHSHCEARGLQDVLVYAEGREKGIVDRHCTVLRVWQHEQTDADGKPRILHPQHDELDSRCHTDLGKIMGAAQQWFDWLGNACKLDNIVSGKVYVGEEEKDLATARRQIAQVTGFKELGGLEASGHCEYFCTPGYLEKDMAGNLYFVRRSFGNCTAHLEDPHLLAELPNPHRILTVPFPFLDPTGKKLVYPDPGYDSRFNSYLIKDAPSINHEMTVARAKEILERIHSEFCFLNPQSKVHAISRIITPFARGLLGFTTRVPLWIYRANRPRAGKDYLAVMTILVYEGIAAEDSPIDKQSEETGKRLMSAARNGRRFMHFSNCAGTLDDIHLTQAITNERITARRLGSNEATSDLSVPNTMEFSISGNIGLNYSEDLEERSRPIWLAYFDEEANGRKFKQPFLHRNVREHRGEVLSAIAALYREWERAGMPLGRDVFTTYPSWAETVGGVMAVNELGNPCLPFKDDTFSVKGDRKTEAMTATYEVNFNVHGDTWIKKEPLFKTTHEASLDTEEDSGVEALTYFCPLQDHELAQKNRLRFGHALSEYNFRVLDGIKMEIDRSSSNRGRWLYRFTKVREDGPDIGPDITTSEKPCDNQKNPENKPKTCHVSRLSRSKASNAAARSETSDSRGEGSNTGSEYGSSALKRDNRDNVTVRENGVAIDIETYSDDPKSKGALDPFKGKIRLVSIADASGIQTFDLREKPLSRELLETIRTSDLIIHNAEFELCFFGRHFGFIPKNVFCTLTAERLLTPSKKIKHDLQATLQRRLGITIDKEIDHKLWGDDVLTDRQLEYAKVDVEHEHTLRKVLAAEIEKAGLSKIFKLESNLLPVTAKMELHGFAVSPEKMQKIMDRENEICDNLEHDIRAEFNLPELNVNSPPQLLEAFEKAGVKLKSTAKDSLIKVKSPIAIKLRAYKKSKKLAGMVKSLLADVKNGRLHSTFLPLGTIHGRFSSKDPNLQNIHRGPELRGCFIPSKIENVLISADYSQIELRVAALITRDDVMLAALKRGEDLHAKIAAINLHCQESEVTGEQRTTVGKSSNFGFIYGQGAKGFQGYARTTWGAELSLDQATAYRFNYFDLYRGIKRWHNECWNKAKYSDLVEARTIWGRRLYPAVESEWGRFNMHTEYVVSGSCADLIKLAMLRVSKAKLPLGAKMVATVHDELVFDVPAATAEESKRIIVEEMTAAFVEMFGTEIPVEVEAKVCANWGEK